MSETNVDLSVNGKPINPEGAPTSPPELHVVFRPSLEKPEQTFVEVEDGAGYSLKATDYGARWVDRPDGMHVLIIPRAVPGPGEAPDADSDGTARPTMMLAGSLARRMHRRAMTGMGDLPEVQAQRMALDGLLALAREERSERDAGKFDDVADVIAGGFEALAEAVGEIRARADGGSTPEQTADDILDIPALTEAFGRVPGNVLAAARRVAITHDDKGGDISFWENRADGRAMGVWRVLWKSRKDGSGGFVDVTHERFSVAFDDAQKSDEDAPTPGYTVADVSFNEEADAPLRCTVRIRANDSREFTGVGPDCDTAETFAVGYARKAGAL